MIISCLLKEERYAQAVKNLEFDRQLGPYALDRYGDWKRLSNYITKNTIESIGEYTAFTLSLNVLTMRTEGSICAKDVETLVELIVKKICILMRNINPIS